MTTEMFCDFKPRTTTIELANGIKLELAEPDMEDVGEGEELIGTKERPKAYDEWWWYQEAKRPQVQQEDDAEGRWKKGDYVRDMFGNIVIALVQERTTDVKTLMVMTWLMARKVGLTKEQIAAREWRMTLSDLKRMLTTSDFTRHVGTIVSFFYGAGGFASPAGSSSKPSSSV